MFSNNGSKEQEKITITIVFEDKETKVSWSKNNTSVKDAKFMFLCTCDSLIDSHFELYDSKGTYIDLNLLEHFENNAVFFLHKAKETKTISNILLDDRRKLFVEIDPLKHIEAQIAIKYLCIGTNILKQTTEGLPHIKLFQLSADLKRILWHSKSKRIEQSQVAIESIQDITIGQLSKKFIAHPIKNLEEFSFSLYYTNKYNKDVNTLDLTCKDEKDFDFWLIGIKALHSHYNSKILSKNDLLSHSNNYIQQVKKGNIGHCSNFLFYSEGTCPKGKCLEKVLLTRSITPLSICIRLYQLSQRQLNLQERIITYSTGGNKTKEISNNAKDLEGYQELYDEEIVDDLETQKDQMSILFNKCQTNMTLIIDDFFYWFNKNKNNTQAYVPDDSLITFGDTMTNIRFYYNNFLPSKFVTNKSINDKVESETFLKDIDIRLWGIEVDLESINGILNQFDCAYNPSFLDKIKALFK